MRWRRRGADSAEQTRLMEAFIHLSRLPPINPRLSVRPSALLLLKIPNRRKFNAWSYIISPVCITYSIGSTSPPSLQSSLLPSSPIASLPPSARILAYFTSLHDS